MAGSCILQSSGGVLSVAVFLSMCAYVHPYASITPLLFKPTRTGLHPGLHIPAQVDGGRQSSKSVSLTMNAWMDRRDMMSFMSGAVLTMLPQSAFASDEVDYLKKRQESEGPIESMPPPLPFGGENQLYWPKWVFGSWTESAILTKATGAVDGVPTPTQVGKTTVQNTRYFSTLADSSKNNMRVTLGLGVPEAEIIEDRMFNYKAALESGGDFKVTEASYDPRADPTFVSLQLQESPSGFVKKVFYVENRKSASTVLDDGRPVWYGSETIRSVSLGPKKVQVGEYEVMTKLVLRSDGDIEGERRVEVYIAPEPVNDSFAMMRTDSSLRIWSRLTMGTENTVNTKLSRPSIASLSYALDMKREASSDGSVCVLTPKGYNQCQPPRFWEG